MTAARLKGSEFWAEEDVALERVFCELKAVGLAPLSSSQVYLAGHDSGEFRVRVGDDGNVAGS